MKFTSSEVRCPKPCEGSEAGLFKVSGPQGEGCQLYVTSS